MDNQIIIILLVIICLSVIIYYFYFNIILDNNIGCDYIIKRFTKKNKKVAIISSIYGNYDKVKHHTNVLNSNLVDWYLFTDNDKLTSPTWKVINTPYHLLNTNYNHKNYYNNYNNIDPSDKRTLNMMSAKYYKIQHHHIDILKDYDYFIWIDGSLHLSNNYICKIFKLINSDYSLINFKHSGRNTVKDEYNESIHPKYVKYSNQNLKNQYDHYIKNRFVGKNDNSLYELTSFIRKNTNKNNVVFDEWWEHNLKYSYQDQISYPYVLWNNKTKPDHIINMNVFANYIYTYVNPFDYH